MKKLMMILAATTVMSAAALAGDGKTFVHVGGAGVLFNSGLVKANNPGVTAASVTDNLTVTVEAGRYLTDNFSLSLAAGFPPTNDLLTNGAKSGTATYGSVIAGGQYHITSLGSFQPYVGAGLAYNITFSTSKLAGADIVIDNGFAPVLQIGAEMPVNNNLGVFVDVKKMFYTAHVTKGALIEDVRLDPWIISAGLAVRF